MNQVLREEKKFLINIAEFRQKSHLLEQALLQDEHNGIHGYRIRSLYFDTPYDRDFFEKQAGTELRRKVRLRIYDTAQTFAMLEMKQKQGEQQLKRSLKISKEDAVRIIHGDLSPLLAHPDPFAAESTTSIRRATLDRTSSRFSRSPSIAAECSISEESASQTASCRKSKPIAPSRPENFPNSKEASASSASISAASHLKSGQSLH